MQLLLTRAELTKLVQAQLGLAEPIEVVLVESADEGPKQLKVARVRGILKQVFEAWPNWQMDQKSLARAIHQFKDMTGWNLFDSRFAICHPDETLRNLALGLSPTGK